MYNIYIYITYNAFLYINLPFKTKYEETIETATEVDFSNPIWIVKQAIKRNVFGAATRPPREREKEEERGRERGGE